MKPQKPRPVKIFAAVFFVNEGFLVEMIKHLESLFGGVDFRSDDYPFTVTDYYVPEMGSPLFRRIYSFEELQHPGDLALFKIRTNQIEDMLSVDGRRQVNIDVGYLDYDKVVLASAKYNWQKIYLDLGIYADLTLHFEKGEYKAFPWSFPDFKEKTYYSAFLRIREIYKKQMKMVQPAGKS